MIMLPGMHDHLRVLATKIIISYVFSHLLMIKTQCCILNTAYLTFSLFATCLLVTTAARHDLLVPNVLTVDLLWSSRVSSSLLPSITPSK